MMNTTLCRFCRPSFIAQRRNGGSRPAASRRAPAGTGNELAQSYGVVSQLAPLILENQPKGRVAAALLEDLTPSQRIRLGDYTLEVSGGGPRRFGPDAAGISQAPARPAPHGTGPPHVGLGTVEEGRFVDGRWAPGRTLAGDDTGQGNNISLRSLRSPGILRVTVYRYR